MKAISRISNSRKLKVRTAMHIGSSMNNIKSPMGNDSSDHVLLWLDHEIWPDIESYAVIER